MAEAAPQLTQLEKIYAPSLLAELPRTEEDAVVPPEQQTHVWYLGYGSNMSEKSFFQRRGIRPTKTMAVFAPKIQLSFNLPGLPYLEPRFANVIILPKDEAQKSKWDESNKNRPWGNGLIGVAYYITVEEMAKIFITEGGGASYQIIQVECHEIGEGNHEGQTITANTLYANKPDRLRNKLGQPSPRYMKLLRDGAREKSLPQAYINYLDNIETYRRTHFRQKLALGIIVLIFAPWVLLTFGLGRLFRNKRGESPRWVHSIMLVASSTVWGGYDRVFGPLFGSGEVTETD